MAHIKIALSLAFVAFAYGSACGGDRVPVDGGSTGSAMVPDCGDGPASVDCWCRMTCGELNTCGPMTDCAASCSGNAGLAGASQCTAEYEQWIECLSLSPGDWLCSQGAECLDVEDFAPYWLKCAWAFCSTSPTPAACALGKPCITLRDCLAGQVCASGTCQVAGTPCRQNGDCPERLP
jgi:hypothetical protein